MTIEATMALTTEELDKALDFLKKTRDDLMETVAGMSEPQWTFKPAAHRWSVGENVEHLGIVETRFLQNIAAVFRDAPVFGADRQRLSDDDVIAAGLNRGTRITAPEWLTPSGTMRPQAAAARLMIARERTREFLEGTPNLREHYREHPVVGAIDGYQWVLLVGAHTERHRLQIFEIQADRHFPAH